MQTQLKRRRIDRSGSFIYSIDQPMHSTTIRLYRDALACLLQHTLRLSASLLPPSRHPLHPIIVIIAIIIVIVVIDGGRHYRYYRFGHRRVSRGQPAAFID